MSISGKVDAILGDLLKGIVTKDTFTLHDIEDMILQAKGSILQVLAEEHAHRMAPLVASFQSVSIGADTG